MKDVEQYRQINRIDQCPRAWLSSEMHSQRARTNTRNMQQGKFSLVTNQNVSQSGWVSSEIGHSERLWNFSAGRLSNLDWKRL